MAQNKASPWRRGHGPMASTVRPLPPNGTRATSYFHLPSALPRLGLDFLYVPADAPQPPAWASFAPYERVIWCGCNSKQRRL